MQELDLSVDICIANLGKVEKPFAGSGAASSGSQAAPASGSQKRPKLAAKPSAKRMKKDESTSNAAMYF